MGSLLELCQPGSESVTFAICLVDHGACPARITRRAPVQVSIPMKVALHVETNCKASAGSFSHAERLAAGIKRNNVKPSLANIDA
jgi:hypothetical protein